MISATRERLPGRVVGVVTGGAGAGATFLSLNLALWASECGVRTVLVDADPNMGSIAASLGLGEERSLENLGHQATLHAVDTSLVEANLQNFRRLRVLAGRAEPGPRQVPTAVFDLLMGTLADQFELVVADVGSLDSVSAVDRAARCHALVWVALPTPVGAVRLDRTITSDLCAPLRGKGGYVVVNRAGSSLPRGASGVLEGEYGLQIAGTVPGDPKACLSAEVARSPAVLNRPLGPILRSVTTFVTGRVLQPKVALGDTMNSPSSALEEFAESPLTGG